MNKLNRGKQTAIVSCLVNGSSVRATERITGVHRDTILRHLVKIGDGCQALMDSEFRNLKCKRIQIDEIHGFVRKKQGHLTASDDPEQSGDFWTFVAIDADARFVPCYRVGKRTLKTTTEFIIDLESRLANRVQISSDALGSYIRAIDDVFGANVDYAQIVKSYEAEPIGPGRYSPPRVSSVSKTAILGNPDPRHISTSYVERSNLHMRMSIRRMTRLTDAFSRKLENFKAAIALHFAYNNYVRIHRSLRVTPAMAAGVSQRVWEMDDLLDAAQNATENRS